ncbi:MAG: hypothetical protein ACR2MQ_04195 [Gemmatimonadaceae bacterium]
MTNEDDRNDDRLMNDGAVEDAVLSYLEATPELMQGIAPERDLWAGVESRISARVLPLGSSAIPLRRSPKSQWTPWLPMAAAAAVLISATSSVTYMLNRRGDAPSGAAVTASSAIGTAAQRTATQQQQVQAAPVIEPTTEPVAVQPRAVAVLPPRHHNDGSVAQPHGSTQNSTQLVSSSEDASTRATYDEEITTLRAALNARRAQLDPATVRTIEQNLSVIDNAIAQSRAALARDPKSRFLGSQLDRSLAKKTDLLRAAALLPSA